MNLEGMNFFGTDGIRGKTDTADLSYMDALILFKRKAVITPALIDLSVRAFVRLIGGTGSSSYVTGSDGRDSVTGNAFVNAMNNAFASSGSKVTYLGVVPTAAVPQYQLENSCLGAAMLTASHNPSNQNGIKFFYEGKKLLPEGELGDLRLSSIMLEIAKTEERPSQEKQANINLMDPADMILKMLEDNIPVRDMRNMHFILDVAAGAWTRYADMFFSRNGLVFSRISADPEGHNINRSCGVAEIEGHESYTRLQIPYAPKIIRALFENPESYGIVTDGDGDRGMLLKYDASSDTVKVYDGDEEAFLIMGLLSRSNRCQGHIVCTLESDIMASVSFSESFGSKSVITDVGDKWICNCDLDDLVIGFESSGHVIIPVSTGNGKLLLSGNGLLTAALAAFALESGLKSFKRGFSKTYYIYFVNKDLFCAGSELFEQDAKMLDKELSKALCGTSGLSYERRAFKDRNVLAYQVVRDGLVVALIVSRNSGTEDKNAVYLKCTPDLTALLEPVARSLASHHRDLMRNNSLPEMEVVRDIMLTMERTGSYTVSETQSKDTMFTSVLHALEREGKIKGDGSRFIPVEG
ncbi:MAG: hypothetical protein ILP16_04930 [Spirochaetales bacterium]|nr:hypothetical protein [Spirochaetales bacterium]